MTEKEILASLSEKANKENTQEKKENSVTSKEFTFSSDNEDFDGFPTPEMYKNQEATEENNQELHVENTSSQNSESIFSENSENSSEQNTYFSPEQQKSSLNEKSSLAHTQENNKENQKDEEETEEEKPMTLLEHLKEFRVRLTRTVVIIIIGFFACYNIADIAYALLSEPLKATMPTGSSFIYTSPPGAFFVYLKVSFVLSFFASSPYTFYQLWAFVAPGLYKEEKKVLIPLAIISAFFFLAGAAFCYFFVFPVAFKFFMGFASDAIVPMISIEEYLSFVLKLLIAFGLVFEMPLFAFFLARMGLLTAKKMRSWRKYAVLIMFITAALLTPPDVFSQILMAIPMILLYEISILITVLVEKDKKKEKNNQEDCQDNSQDNQNTKNEVS